MNLLVGNPAHPRLNCRALFLLPIIIFANINTAVAIVTTIIPRSVVTVVYSLVCFDNRAWFYISYEALIGNCKPIPILSVHISMIYEMTENFND